MSEAPTIPPAIVLHRTGVRRQPAWEWVLSIEFKIEDLWVGAFWKRKGNSLDVWVCLLPCLPIHWSGWRFKEPHP